MQPDLENIKNKVQANRDLIEKITSHIPGFGGYVEKQEMYDADTIIRDFIADKIQQMKNEVNSLTSELVKSGEIGVLTDIDSINTKLETLYKKCKHADFGKSGGTSNIKTTEDDLNRLLEYDWRLIATAEEILPIVQNMAGADSGEIGNAIKEVKNKLKEFEQSFDDRKNVLMEVI